MILITHGKESRKYSVLILCIALFSIAYSFLYHILLGEYFSVWEFIHVCGPSVLFGYGILLFLNSGEFNKSIYEEDALVKITKITVTAGIVVFGFGIWWIIIIIYHYPRFLYWPFFWIISFLSSVCCIGAGVFSLLLARNMKKLIPLIKARNNKTIFPVFRYMLVQRIPGIVLVCISLFSMVYQTGLFPIWGL